MKLFEDIACGAIGTEELRSTWIAETPVLDMQTEQDTENWKKMHGLVSRCQNHSGRILILWLLVRQTAIRQQKIKKELENVLGNCTVPDMYDCGMLVEIGHKVRTVHCAAG